MKDKTINTLEDNTKQYLHDLRIGKDFLNKLQKMQTVKEKTDKLVYIKIKRDFPGGTVGKTLCSRGPGSIPAQRTRSHMHAETKSSHATTKEPASLN